MSGDGALPADATYVVLTGGSGGVKLAAGLARLLGERLAILVNTGDDFTHLGLSISPDIDTVLYSLSGRINDETGWGRSGETWTFMGALGELGAPTGPTKSLDGLQVEAVRALAVSEQGPRADLDRRGVGRADHRHRGGVRGHGEQGL